MLDIHEPKKITQKQFIKEAIKYDLLEYNHLIADSFLVDKLGNFNQQDHFNALFFFVNNQPVVLADLENCAGRGITEIESFVSGKESFVKNNGVFLDEIFEHTRIIDVKTQKLYDKQLYHSNKTILITWASHQGRFNKVPTKVWGKECALKIKDSTVTVFYLNLDLIDGN